MVAASAAGGPSTSAVSDRVTPAVAIGGLVRFTFSQNEVKNYAYVCIIYVNLLVHTV